MSCGPCAELSSPSLTWCLIKCIPVDRKQQRRGIRPRSTGYRENLHIANLFSSGFPKYCQPCTQLLLTQYIRSPLNCNKYEADALNIPVFLPHWLICERAPQNQRRPPHIAFSIYLRHLKTQLSLRLPVTHTSRTHRARPLCAHHVCLYDNKNSGNKNMAVWYLAQKGWCLVNTCTQSHIKSSALRLFLFLPVTGKQNIPRYRYINNIGQPIYPFSSNRL